MDTNQIKSFRYRLRKFGYRNIMIKKLKNVCQDDSDVRKYQVFAIEPCFGQRVCFLITENEMEIMFRSVFDEKR